MPLISQKCKEIAEMNDYKQQQERKNSVQRNLLTITFAVDEYLKRFGVRNGSVKIPLDKILSDKTYSEFLGDEEIKDAVVEEYEAVGWSSVQIENNDGGYGLGGAEIYPYWSLNLNE